MSKLSSNEIFKVMAKPEGIFPRVGLSPEFLQAIGGIGVIASLIEYHLEQAIWVFEGQPIQGERPWTDGKPISSLVERLRKLSEATTDGRLKRLALEWCDAADVAFHCRHSLMHGLPVWLGGDSVNFMRNTRWGQIERKKDPAEFMADQHTLSMIQDVFAVLIRVLTRIKDWPSSPLIDSDYDFIMRGLKHAHSIAGELHDLSAYMNHEKN